MIKKAIVVMSAYNAAKTLGDVYKKIPHHLVSHIVLVDDYSKDKTIQISKSLGIETITHKKNLGYGGNQKTCYENALKLEGDLIISLHPDAQYDPNDISKMIDKYNNSGADIIFGSRFIEDGGKSTPFYKTISIRFITILYNIILGTKLTEVNTGYRAYSRKALNSIPWNKNGNSFIFDPQIIVQSVVFNLIIDEVPIRKDYHPAASSPNFIKSLYHGLENIYLLLLYILHKYNFKKIHFLTLDK